MKGADSGKTSKAKRGTDWNRLRRMSEADIRKGIESDPDVRPTDEKFWKDAKVVLPRRKKVVTMRLDADLSNGSANSGVTRRGSMPFFAPT